MYLIYFLTIIFFNQVVFCAQNPQPKIDDLVAMRISTDGLVSKDKSNTDQVNQLLYALTQGTNLSGMNEVVQENLISALVMPADLSDKPKHKEILNRQLLVNGNSEGRTFCQLLARQKSSECHALLKQLFEGELVDKSVRDYFGDTIMHAISGVKPFGDVSWALDFFTAEDLRVIHRSQRDPVWKFIIANESTDEKTLKKLIDKLNPTDGELGQMNPGWNGDNHNRRNFEIAYEYGERQNLKKIAACVVLFFSSIGIVYAITKRYEYEDVFLALIKCLNEIQMHSKYSTHRI